MRHLMRTRQRGLTLIELMVALAIAVILALAAAPFYGDYVANSRLREGGNLLLTETLYAQSEALKRNAPMRVTVNGSSIEVADVSTVTAPVVLRTSELPAPVVRSSSINFLIDADGRPSPFGTDVSVDLALANAACSADRRCPGLRIDAGGAVRLCADTTAGCT